MSEKGPIERQIVSEKVPKKDFKIVSERGPNERQIVSEKGLKERQTVSEQGLKRRHLVERERTEEGRGNGQKQLTNAGRYTRLNG